MGFYGAAWDGERVRVEPLSPRFDLAIHRKEMPGMQLLRCIRHCDRDYPSALWVHLC